MLLLFLFPASLYAAPHTKYEVEAAFVHNIAKFVEWPTSVSAKGALRLCVLGQGPFGEAAENLLKDKQVGGRGWKVIPVSARVNLNECNVLFIGTGAKDELLHLLDDIKDSPVLTVGDTEGYAGKGVMVNFYNEQNKVRFEVNNDAAVRSGLRISSHLLKLARIVADNGALK